MKDEVREIERLSKYLLALLIPWNSNEDGEFEAEFELSNRGFLEILKKWDNSEASEINKQRFLRAQKILQRQQAPNSFKEALSNWRSRGVD